MTIDKDYFLSRLQNGEDVDTICKDVTTMMNNAKRDYDIQQAEKQIALKEQEKAKKDLIKEMFEIVEELAILEGVDPEDVRISDEELEDMYKTFSELFRLMKSIKSLKRLRHPLFRSQNLTLESFQMTKLLPILLSFSIKVRNCS